MSHHIPAGPLGLLVLLAGSFQVAGASPQNAFDSMSGFWMGPGRIEFDGGASEALVCRAYYTTAGQANRLNVALRCSSRSNKIELRAKLAAEGSHLTGTWEERTFNASGTVSGQATEQEISLSIDGGGFTATMQVLQEGAHQSVSIATQGVGFKSVSVSLTRSAGDQEDEPERARG
jgi:hypothetical protein